VAGHGDTVRAVILVVAATALELEGLAAETLECGIGPVEAAAQTARGIAARRPDTILHVGIAGARGIEPPALVIGSEAIYEDAERSALVADRVTPDAELLERARVALPAALVLPIGTTARVGAGRACQVEAMEGFSVLRAAKIAGVPALEVRAISNDPAEPDRGRWQFEAALGALREAVPRLLSALE
jgi:nucleoside phosphorylase